MQNVADVIIDHTISFMTRLDLLMFSKINKYYRKQSLKHKTNKFKKVILCTNAAFEGYLDILIYLRNNGRKPNSYWDSNICTCVAAKNGHLEVLKWARRNDCIVNSNMCIYAAENGQLSVLKW